MDKPFDFMKFVGSVAFFVLLSVPVWFLFGTQGAWLYALGVVGLFVGLFVLAVFRV